MQTDFDSWGKALAVMVGSSAVITAGTVTGLYSISRSIIKRMKKA